MTIAARSTKSVLKSLSAAAALCLMPQAAQATTVQQHLDQGYAYVDTAMKYDENGEYRAACRSYRSARDELAGAILGTIGGEQRIDNAQGVQDQVNAIIARMEIVCKIPDGPPPPRAVAGSGQYSANANLDQDEVRRAFEQANGQYQQASRLYSAKDFTGACAAARLSASGFAQVVSTLKANPALESAFANPAQIYANAQQAKIDRDEFYCVRS